MTGNTQLFDYGIQNEGSDLRAHVCVNAQRVYVYKTCDGVEAIQNGNYRARPVYTNGIQTALGFAVPVTKISGIATVDVPPAWMGKIAFCERESTSVKGNKAVVIVQGLIKRGMFPLLPLHADIIEDKAMQISGTDIKVSLSIDVNIQVKCDYKGGVGNGCTGNLYLQTHECNPMKAY